MIWKGPRYPVNAVHMHYTKKVMDICQYLDLNAKIKANSLNCTKHLENFIISSTFSCSVHCAHRATLSSVLPYDERNLMRGIIFKKCTKITQKVTVYTHACM